MIALTDVINYTGVQEMSNLARFALGLVVHLIRSFWPSPSPFRFCVGSGSHKHLFWRSVFHSFFSLLSMICLFSPLFGFIFFFEISFQVNLVDFVINHRFRIIYYVYHVLINFEFSNLNSNFMLVCQRVQIYKKRKIIS